MTTQLLTQALEALEEGIGSVDNLCSYGIMEDAIIAIRAHLEAQPEPVEHLEAAPSLQVKAPDVNMTRCAVIDHTALGQQVFLTPGPGGAVTFMPHGKAQPEPVVVPADTDADSANKMYGEAYGVDWVYAAAPTQPAPQLGTIGHVGTGKTTLVGAVLGRCCYGGMKPKEACASCACWKAEPKAAPQPLTEWQPIETAPRDQFLLLATEFDCPGDWRIKVGEYRTRTRSWHVFGASWTPTRWMPLPAPPNGITAPKGTTTP